MKSKSIQKEIKNDLENIMQDVSYGEWHIPDEVITYIEGLLKEERQRTLEEVRDEYWEEYDKIAERADITRVGERPRVLPMEIIQRKLSKLT